MRRVLVPCGRVAAIVFAPAYVNGFFSVPVSIVRRHAKLGAPTPPDEDVIAALKAGHASLLPGSRACRNDRPVAARDERA
jgi:hypothetical protein